MATTSSAKPSAFSDCDDSFFTSIASLFFFVRRESTIFDDLSWSTIAIIRSSSNVVIEAVKVSSLSAVKVEPPITNKVVLVEDGTIRAEEGVLGKTALSVRGANVEDLAFSLGIGIVTSINLAITSETRFRDFGIDRVVFTRNTRNVGLKGCKLSSSPIIKT